MAFLLARDLLDTGVCELAGYLSVSSSFGDVDDGTDVFGGMRGDEKMEKAGKGGFLDTMQ